MNQKKLILTGIMVGLLAMLIVAAAIVVKWQFFPAAKDSYFTADSDQLRKVPAGLVIVRPSHFTPSNHDRIRHIHEGESLARTVGHNVSLRDLIAEAYDWDPSRVVLPPDAPKGKYDFLVTVSLQTRKHLQAAIRENLGYVGHRETRDTAVLVLKIIHPNLTGLTVSPESETADINLVDGRLQFKHQPLSTILNGLETGLTLPVLDQTGLTNCYDFSVVWNEHILQKMQAGDFDRAGVDRVLNDWGLELVPDTRNLDLLQVNRVN